MNWQLGLALVLLVIGLSVFIAGFIGQTQDKFNFYWAETLFVMIVGLTFIFIGGAIL